MRQIAEFIAVLSSSLFAGAAVYVSLVEHPARIECGVEIAAAQFPPSYHRGTIMQVTLAAVCLLSSIAAWLAGATFWWVIAGVLIRVWMRTAVRKDVTSFGTFLSTLTHEFCHHLDFEKFGFHDSWHTRGFYDRASLYHSARGTPPKKLFWVAMPSGRWRIDWPHTNRGA
jgi:hypothetical protein